MAGELAFFRNQGLLKTTATTSPWKAPVFPFSRFPGVDPVLEPEMKSTGEVIGTRYEVEHLCQIANRRGIKLPVHQEKSSSRFVTKIEGLVALAEASRWDSHWSPPTAPAIS